MVMIRSLSRSIFRTSFRFSATSTAVVNHHLLRHFRLGSPSASATYKSLPSVNLWSPFSLSIGSTRAFSDGMTHLPVIKDPEIEIALKDLMATSWDELPAAVVHDAKKAVSKNTDDKAGQEALLNAFRAAEAVEEFAGRLSTLKMAMDDSIGLSGEDVKPMPKEFVNALETVFQRYTTYLDSFGPEEGFLKKKVEMEIGTKMIHLKMRGSGLGSEWGKVTVFGTSGLSGSYIEHRA